MPIIRDDENLTTSNIRLSLGELLNAFAFLIKAITGESSWKTPASISIAELAQKQSYPGPKGDKGDKGDTGAQGVQGLKGDPGLKGDKGDKGDTGAQGVQGSKGDRGEPGVKGDKGDTGAQGVQGLKGDPGPKGDKGDKGDTGAQGVQGLKGDRGEPAPLDHTHALANVSGLQTELNTKATIDHNHVPEAWQDIPLSSSWSNYGTGFVTPQCRKLVGNLIEVRGTIKKSSAAVANEVVATLPIDYRPSATMHFITWASNGYSRLQVDSNGTMRLISGNSIGLGLNFIFGLN